MLDYSIGTMNEYLGRENVTAQYSPCGRLVLFDYNKTAVFSRDWDRLTLTARGIVFEVSTGNLIAHGYDKFFNVEEPEVGGIEHLPSGAFRALEKADGSCIISFFYDGEWWYITCGSFVSDQAKWAKVYATTHLNMQLANTSSTHIFEVIYPENRIVIDYNSTEALVLTGVRDLVSGVECDYDQLINIAVTIGTSVVKSFPFNSLTEAMVAREGLTINEEGYVLTYSNGFKVKVKGAEYCKVHRAISNITPLHFYREVDVESMEVNRSFIESIPEEFREDVDNLKDLIETLHRVEYNRISKLAESVPVFDDTRYGKKCRFEYVRDNYDTHDVSHILNYITNNISQVKQHIHRKVRPKRNMIEGKPLSPILSRMMGELND